MDFSTPIASAAKVAGFPVSSYQYTTSTLTNGVTYSYGIRTEAAAQDSNRNSAAAIADDVDPSAPTDLTAAVVF